MTASVTDTDGPGGSVTVPERSRPHDRHMTDTIDADRPAGGPEQAEPERALETAATPAGRPPRGDRRLAARTAKADRRAAKKTARSGDEQLAAAAVEVRIDDGDPLLDLLRDSAGPLDIAALPAVSPAVKRMVEQGVQMVVPLVTNGELVGVVALGGRRSERSYTRADKRLLDNLARYAAPALRVGQLMREQEAEARERERIDQELRIAQLIQQQFLPKSLPEFGGWRLAAYYQPARTVGGDFYDVIPLPNGHVMVVAGDVTDKGVPAALVMASTHALLRSAAETAGGPGEVLRRVNDLLIPQIPDAMFVTCLALEIDLESGIARFANAGHNLPYIRRGDAVLRFEARGMPLGLLPGSPYDEVDAIIEPGDVVMLYSDGITEQHDAAGEMFGFPRTAAVVAAATGPDDLIDRAVRLLDAFSAGVEQEDDITIVSLYRDAGSAPAEVSFEVPSEIGNERDIMDRVGAIVGPALPALRLDALKTAVSETAMNAIEHGNHAIDELDVRVTVRTTSDAVTVDIADHGRGRSRPAVTPDLDLKLSGAQTPRGWGLFLVQELTDEVAELEQDGQHVVRLTMHRDRSPRPSGTGEDR